MSKPRLIVVGPLPPPTHGVTVSTALVLQNRQVSDLFRVQHLDTSDHRPRQTIGRWDAVNVLLGLRHAARLLRMLVGQRGLVYLPLSQGGGGFARDSLFIWSAHLAGWKVAAHLRGSDFDTFLDGLPGPLRLYAHKTITRLDSVAVMSPRLIHLFSDLIDGSRIAVVPNGCPNIQRRRRRQHGPVLYLSNMRARKGAREAVEAAVQVVSKDRSARFVFAGEWEDDELQSELLVKTEGLRKQITFLGSVDGRTAQELLAEASIFLFPPHGREGHPRVILEAMSAGLPIVTTDRGAIADSVIDGVSGFVLPEPDPEALADRILALLRDRDLRARMGKAARSTYLKGFTQDRADRRLADWLAGVAGVKDGSIESSRAS